METKLYSTNVTTDKISFDLKFCAMSVKLYVLGVPVFARLQTFIANADRRPNAGQGFRGKTPSKRRGF